MKKAIHKICLWILNKTNYSFPKEKIQSSTNLSIITCGSDENPNGWDIVATLSNGKKEYVGRVSQVHYASVTEYIECPNPNTIGIYHDNSKLINKLKEIFKSDEQTD